MAPELIMLLVGPNRAYDRLCPEIEVFTQTFTAATVEVSDNVNTLVSVGLVQAAELPLSKSTPLHVVGSEEPFLQPTESTSAERRTGTATNFVNIIVAGYTGPLHW